MRKYFEVLWPMSVAVAVGYFGIAMLGQSTNISKLNDRLDAAELALAAKVQPKIKFYTIPGYNCDTSNIPGHCSNNWELTQAEYDKKNSHLFKVTR